MPNWKFHLKWAKDFGIPFAIANWVNMREDMPKIDHKFNDPELERIKANMPNYQPTYEEMAAKGELYAEAWVLHLVLDELENISIQERDDIIVLLLERFELEFFKVQKEIKITRDFLKQATIEVFTSRELIRVLPESILNFVIPNLELIVEELPSIEEKRIIQAFIDREDGSDGEIKPVNDIHKMFLKK